MAPCCAAPALKTYEGSNITANHSLPHPGSTSKPRPLCSSHSNREHQTRLAAPSSSFLSKPSPLERSWRLSVQKCSHLACVWTTGTIIAATTGSSISVASFRPIIQVVHLVSTKNLLRTFNQRLSRGPSAVHGALIGTRSVSWTVAK